MSYYREYMKAILISISEGVNVVGCLAWSFVDNFEVRHDRSLSTLVSLLTLNSGDPGMPSDSACNT